MKQFITVCRAALLVAFLVSFAACKGGTFIDPGQGGGGGSGGFNYNNNGNNEDNGGNDNNGNNNDNGGNDNNGSNNNNGGNDNNGNNNNNAAKPAKLATTASQATTLAKLDEIIAYCNAHSGNDGVKATATGYKSTVNAIQSSVWIYQGSVHITTINTTMIDLLQ